MDIIFIALAIAFFGGCVGLVRLCARLEGGSP